MKQEIDFVKFNPTQNMTILVRTKHRQEEYTHIASKMMSYDSVHAEQVGFIRTPANHRAAAYLQMAGGEFCGNACMALAAYIASERGIIHNDLMSIDLEASGTNRLVACQVKKVSEQYVCCVSVPVPQKIEQKSVRYEGENLEMAIVRYADFVHIVIEVERFNRQVRDRAQGLAELLGAMLGTSLIGVLLYNPALNEMAPLIYVPSLDSLIWERGCGSGTASLGAYMSWSKKGAISAQIKQPGGIIQVTADCSEDEITELKIEGTVEIVAQGRAYINV